MTQDIALVLAVLAGTLVLFMRGRMRPDLVALAVLAVLPLLGLVTPEQAVSGFSNPAVVTVWAVFIVSGALTRTGVAAGFGVHIARLGAGRPTRLLLVVMSVAASLSAFMNNVAVAAMLLPALMDVSERIRVVPSRLLMPLATATLMGGMVTMIGTPPNLLVTAGVQAAGLEPFGLFDFARLGLPMVLVAVGFTVLVGPRLLPVRDTGRLPDSADGSDVSAFELAERLQVLRIPEGSPLAGQQLADTALRRALGLNVIAILRAEERHLAPEPGVELREGDRLVAIGRLTRLQALKGWDAAPLPRARLTLPSGALGVVSPGDELVGHTARQLDFRGRFGVSILAIGGVGTSSAYPADVALDQDMALLVAGPPDRVAALKDETALTGWSRLDVDEAARRFDLDGRLGIVTVPPSEEWEEASLDAAGLGAGFGLTVVGHLEDDTVHPLEADHALAPGQRLVVSGSPRDLSLVGALQELEVSDAPAPSLDQLQSDGVGLAEVILSPHTSLAGSTLREMRFQDKFRLTVVAVWSAGHVMRSGLANRPVQLGDALLVYGTKAQLAVLGAETDFIVLDEEAQEEPRREKAPLAAGVLVAALTPVFLGWVALPVAVVAASVVMIVSGCLDMEEAYRYIDWRAVFIIAGLVPLGIALEETGGATWLADLAVGALLPHGWVAVVAGLFLLTNLLTNIMPNAVVAVLMTPIALEMAGIMAVSPFALAMVVATGASAALMSPVGHPSNLLVMGPGGYTFRDYVRFGLPLTLVLLVVLLVLLPWAWPLTPGT